MTLLLALATSLSLTSLSVYDVSASADYMSVCTVLCNTLSTLSYLGNYWLLPNLGNDWLLPRECRYWPYTSVSSVGLLT